MIRNFEQNYKTLLQNSHATSHSGITPNDIVIQSSSLLDNYNNNLIETTETPNGNPALINTSTIYVGRSILTNNSSVDQTLRTDGFERQEKFTTTSTITHGFNIGINASATFSFNIFLSSIETTLSVDTNYNFSSEQAYSSEVTKTITIPSQEVLVPANSSVEVLAYFTKGTAKGTVDIEAIFGGTDYVIYTYKNPSTGNLVDPIYALDVPGAVASHTSQSQLESLGFDYELPSKLIAKGAGEYTCDVANQYMVSITPITNTNNKETSKTQFKRVSAIVTTV